MPTHPQVTLIQTLTTLAHQIHSIAHAKGWWDEPRNDGEIQALMQSELSEALETLRHGNQPSGHIPEFSGVEEEMAVLIIRVLDAAAARGWRVGEALVAKMEFNERRPYPHGEGIPAPTHVAFLQLFYLLTLGYRHPTFI